MNTFQINNEILGFVFNRLRIQEGKRVGRITAMMDNVLVFKILINARYKQERKTMLSDLERTIREESGINICAYVSQKYDQAKQLGEITSMPYQELENKTIGDIERFHKKNNHRILGIHMIA